MMNKNRRKELSEIINQLNNLKEKVEGIRDVEQEGFDNLSDGLQQTMRGSQMEEAISNLESAIDLIDETIYHIDEASM